jgi:hypothetical protein
MRHNGSFATRESFGFDTPKRMPLQAADASRGISANRRPAT